MEGKLPTAQARSVVVTVMTCVPAPEMSTVQVTTSLVVVGKATAGVQDGVRAPETESLTVISVLALIPLPPALSATVKVSVCAAGLLVMKAAVEKEPVGPVTSRLIVSPGAEAVEVLLAISV